MPTASASSPSTGCSMSANSLRRLPKLAPVAEAGEAVGRRVVVAVPMRPDRVEQRDREADEQQDDRDHRADGRDLARARRVCAVGPIGSGELGLESRFDAPRALARAELEGGLLRPARRDELGEAVDEREVVPAHEPDAGRPVALTGGRERCERSVVVALCAGQLLRGLRAGRHVARAGDRGIERDREDGTRLILHLRDHDLRAPGLVCPALEGDDGGEGDQPERPDARQQERWTAQPAEAQGRARNGIG